MRLAGASPDYCHLLQIYARFDDWAQAYRQAPELLVAFARDVHAVQLVVAVAKKGASALAHELAVLRASTERFAGLWHELGMIERAALTLAPAGLAKPIRFPALPEAQSPGWVSRLAVMAPEQALSEVIRVESEVRAFLAGPRERVAAELEICRDECGQIVNQVLEEYWAQLRAHARLYYVEERDTADVIAMLTQRYVDRDIQRRQRVISASPFGPER